MTPKHEDTDAMGMERQRDEGRPCTCHPDDSPPSPCAEKFALSECRATTQPAEQSGARLPTVAPNTERLRADAANFMQHNTDDHCRRMCRVGVDDLAVLLAWVAQFPTLGEAK